jgi:uncharacterized protein
MAGDDPILREVVQRIVAVAHPEKIILFGSSARLGVSPDRDLDLLVVKAGSYHPVTATREIYRALRDLRISKDIIVATPEEIERYRHQPALVFCPALREGKVIFDRAA